MFDCGMHMSYDDARRFPDFASLKRQEITIDALVVTHFHLDHCGALPHYVEQVGYAGPILMTVRIYTHTHTHTHMMACLGADKVHLSNPPGRLSQYRDKQDGRAGFFYDRHDCIDTGSRANDPS